MLEGLPFISSYHSLIGALAEQEGNLRIFLDDTCFYLKVLEYRVTDSQAQLHCKVVIIDKRLCV